MVWSLFRRKRPDPVLEALGLRPKDVSARARDALAILVDQNASLKAQLKDAMALADRDPHLPAMNRRAFLRELARTASYVARYKTEAAVLFIDLNNFKQVNDAYGHAAGDAVLKHVSRLIVQNIRDSDRIGRVGGDEFAVLLAQAGREEAQAKAQSLAAAIMARPCLHAGVRHQIGASVGAHAFRWSDEHATLDPEVLLARADEAMYAAKHAARRAAVANG
jgi:diguanylate cyclase (GGDEF)-like protein